VFVLLVVLEELLCAGEECLADLFWVQYLEWSAEAEQVAGQTVGVWPADVDDRGVIAVRVVDADR
jgi:hypothetical protein